MSVASMTGELFSALVEELTIVVGAMIDGTPSVAEGSAPAGKQWVADVQVDGPLKGAVKLILDDEGSIAVTKVMTGIEGDVATEVLRDTLREVLAQALGALSHKPISRGAKWSLARLDEQTNLVPDGESSAHVITAEKLDKPLTIAVWGSVTAAPAVEPEVVPVSALANLASDPRIEVLLDIDLPLVVRFGRTELPLRQLTRLGPGSVIDLGRSPDDPVEVLVSNRVVARGEVVVVSGSYGIRILDVVSQRERVRSMEA